MIPQRSLRTRWINGRLSLTRGMSWMVAVETCSTNLDFLPATVREASDERNFVKKAVNWAVRQIGKRNSVLNSAAIKTCAEIRNSGSGSAKWIAADALRELTSSS